MKYLSKVSLSDKNVILRCDFNVPVKNGVITDNSKITRSLKTINYLLENNNKIILLSHFGRVKKDEDKEKNSLYVVYEELKKFIDIEFIKDPSNLEGVNNSIKKCFLVENTRFTDIPEKRESANDLELSRYWANYADVFVLDAFGSMHRAHSSTAGISKYLPTYFGFLVEEELENLNILVNDLSHPFVVIMGGAKVDDKIKIIESMLAKCDKLILTGGILNTFLKVSNKNVGDSLVSDDKEVLECVENILNKYQEKIYFTNRFLINRNNDIKEISIDELIDGDIIYDNVTNLKEILSDAKIVFFNGTCGKYEEDSYAKGTKNLLNDLKCIPAKVIIGGGDTVSAVIKLGFEKDFDYLSSGGGATLEYVSSGKMKALEFIKENGVDNS